MAIDERMEQEILNFMRKAPRKTRDPERIEPFLGEFQERILAYWKKHPDYRFGQILMLLQAELARKGKKDFFYLEEADFLKELDAFIAE